MCRGEGQGLGFSAKFGARLITPRACARGEVIGRVRLLSLSVRLSLSVCLSVCLSAQKTPVLQIQAVLLVLNNLQTVQNVTPAALSVLLFAKYTLTNA